MSYLFKYIKYWRFLFLLFLVLGIACVSQTLFAGAETAEQEIAKITVEIQEPVPGDAIQSPQPVLKCFDAAGNPLNDHCIFWGSSIADCWYFRAFEGQKWLSLNKEIDLGYITNSDTDQYHFPSLYQYGVSIAVRVNPNLMASDRYEVTGNTVFELRGAEGAQIDEVRYNNDAELNHGDARYTVVVVSFPAHPEYERLPSGSLFDIVPVLGAGESFLYSFPEVWINDFDTFPVENYPAVKPGSIFQGWYTKPVGGMRVTNQTVFCLDNFREQAAESLTADFCEFITIHLYPHWQAHPAYTLTLDMNAGQDAVTLKGKTVSSYKLNVKAGADPVLPTPKRSGYSFQGYSYTKKYTSFTGDHVVSKPYPFMKDTTIYAMWKNVSVRYLITFDLNDSSRVPTGASSVTKLTGKTNLAFKLTELPTPTQEGFRFLGWFTESQGGKAITTATVFSGDTTVYAHWEALNKYKIIFDANGGRIKTGARTQETLTASTNTTGSIGTLPQPSREGYRFLGWFTRQTGGTKITTKTVYNKNTRVYAHWQKEPVTETPGDEQIEKPIDQPQPEEKPQTSFTRLAGANRYETSYAIAAELKKQYGCKLLPALIIADGRNYPDALAASYLAARKQTAILLTEPTRFGETVSWAKKNVIKAGTIYIAGGPGSVPEDLLKQLRQAGFKVQRLGGKDRYETNLLLLREAKVGIQEILVCTGTDFPDCLSASSVALPILLVRGEGLTATQKSYLSGLKTKSFTIIGSKGVVSSGVENDLKKIGRVKRILGITCYDRSVNLAVNYYGKTSAGASGKKLFLASGEVFPDGLCGGPLAIASGCPLLLSASRQDIYEKALRYNQTRQAVQATVLGGAVWISDAAIKKILLS